MQRDRTISRSKWIAGGLLAMLCLPAAAQQIFIGGARPVQNRPRTGNFFPEDRRMTRALREIPTFIRAGNYDVALKSLQAIINSERDFCYYVDPEKKDRFLSLKVEAMRLIESLPEKGRQAYELTYGLPAQTRLDDALKSGNFKEIEEIARQFFHTQAGYRATYLLAMKRLDQGHALTAALQFERLRRVTDKVARAKFEPMLSLQTAVCWGRAGMPERSIDTLVELKQYANGEGIVIGGRTFELFAAREAALPWLARTLGSQRGFTEIGKEQWIMFRGDASRTARSAPTSPVWDSRWTLDTVNNPDVHPAEHAKILEGVAAEIKSFARTRRKDGLLMQPAGHPLIVGDLAVFRTLRGVWAVDVRTGNVMWRTIYPDSAFEEEAKLVSKAPTAQVNGNVQIRRYPSAQTANLTPLQMVLDQRLWRDMTAGTLSSDGKFVYAVEDLGFHNRGNTYRYVRGRVLMPELPGYNSLAAFDAKTGAWAWWIGGSESRANPLPLAGHFFLGPPLPMGGQLFCLADYRGEIRLLAIGIRKETNDDGRLIYKPHLLWYQTLIHPDENVTRYPLRRMAGLTPSYAGGVLICPTTGGAIVAVDPARRLLLWGYPYSTNISGNGNGRNGFIGSTPYGLPTNPYDGESRWLDAAVTISGNYVILTPRDSNELHCVSLDGTKLWKKSRGQLLYVAAVHNQNVVLAGKTQLVAYRLSDGKPVWKQDTPLPVPSGRGFQTGSFYHIPLETAEIATVDLSNGRVLARTKTRSGAVPGNLASANGLIVSQSVDHVMAFRPFDAINREIAAKLAANPGDPAALALRGEIRLRSGDEDGGLADLRKSIAGNPSDRARSLVASNLLEGLRLDFARFRKYRPELEKLLTTDALRGRYHRLLAAGLHEVGEHHEAFKEYVKLAGPNTGPWREERISGDLRVRSDRWLRTRVADVFRKSDPAQRKLLVAELRQQLEAASQHTGPVALRRYVAAFGTLPGTDDARLELAKRLDRNGDALELEFLLEKLRGSGNRKTAGFATARLADLFAVHGQFAAAADLIVDLEERFARVVCIDGRTGRQSAEALKKRNPEFATALAARTAWPRNRIVASTSHTSTRYSTGSYPLDIEGSNGPYFREWSFSLGSSGRLEARDGQGRSRWSVSMQAGNRNPYNYRWGNSLRIHGHLFVVTMGNHFLVIDALSKSPRVLWHRDLYEAPFGQPANQGVRVRQIIRGANGRIRWLISDPYGNPLGTVGPVTNDAIVYQAGRTLFAASPTTGEVLWKRGSIERGSRLFGDEDYVFVVAPGATTATVLRSSDGSLITSRPVAGESVRKASRGRFELTFRTSGNKQVLAWVDLFQKQIVWQKHFDDDARVQMIEGEEIAVVEPKKGRFVVFALADGASRLKSRIEPDDGVGNFFVRRSKKRYVLMTHSPGNRNAGRFNAAVLNNFDQLVNGYVYGFDRKTGKKIWTTFVENQAVNLDQPDSVPVLIFACRRYEVLNGRRIGVQSQRLAVTILDTRNGRLVLDYSGRLRSTSPYQMNIDPVARKIELRFYELQVSLAMVDRPLDPPDARVEPRPKVKPRPKNAVQRNAPRIRLNLVVPRGGRARPAPRPAAPRR
jgi:outer membrane protein assembly factor BamB